MTGAQAAPSPTSPSDTLPAVSEVRADTGLGEPNFGLIDGAGFGAQIDVVEYVKASLIRVAQAGNEQTAALPVGTIRLRVIPQIGGNTVNEPIKWRITTFGRDSSGTRPTVAEVTGSTPELVLPAGWYVVHARMADTTIKHPVEVTAGRTFKYTLVKN